MIAFQIAQIQTGNGNIDYFINGLLLQYGAGATLVIIFVAYFAYTLWRQNKRNDENEQFILDTAQKQQKTQDDLIKTKDELSAYKMEAAKKEGVFEGRIAELSDTMKRQQEKFDEREKALQRELDRLTAESKENKDKLEKLQAEIDGKDKTIVLLTAERDTQKSTIADLQREKLELESQVESLKKTIAEQAEQIISLGKELVEAKAVAAAPSTTPEPTKPEPAKEDN